jgi:hypothetical protein
MRKTVLTSLAHADPGRLPFGRARRRRLRLGLTAANGDDRQFFPLGTISTVPISTMNERTVELDDSRCVLHAHSVLVYPPMPIAL